MKSAISFCFNPNVDSHRYFIPVQNRALLERPFISEVLNSKQISTWHSLSNVLAVYASMLWNKTYGPEFHVTAERYMTNNSFFNEDVLLLDGQKPSLTPRKRRYAMRDSVCACVFPCHQFEIWHPRKRVNCSPVETERHVGRKRHRAGS